MLNKKSQITGFIIIGLILLIAGASFYYARSTFLSQGFETPELLSVPDDETSLKEYVQSCISRVVSEALPEIALNGGLVSLDDNFIWHDKNKFRIFCNHVEGLKSCQNAFITRQDIEAEIESVLPELLESCLNFDAFTSKGVQVLPGEMDFDIKIGVNDITATLEYPVTLEYRNKQIKVDNYFAVIPSNFGFLYDLALAITNEEIEKGSFNKDKWMAENNVFINIEKHRPYPHITYSLKRNDQLINENLEFRFSLQGEDTSVKIGSTPSFLEEGKDCINTYDLRCFKNVKQGSCVEKAGQVTKCTSQVPASNTPNCDGSECMPCITGEEQIPHGSSWCVYDSIQKQNKYGLSYVGSRHYKQSCINGNIITEECRDFREELCTQTRSGDSTEAVCRINRWQDCAFCTDEACCMDESKRDCQWDDLMYKYLDGSRVDIQNPDRKCFPKVPPGFRFWDGYGYDVCNIGTQYAHCKGWGACPGSYVDDSALYCLRLGDCGNFRNIADKLTKTGFFNTDPTDIVSSFIYLNNDLNRDPVSELDLDPIASNLYTTEQQLLVSEYPSTIEALPVMMEQAVSYLNYVKKISPNPFVLASLDPDVLEYSFCGLWQPPEKSTDCSMCSSDPDKPCTEYRCKSLSRNCKFESEMGVGSCTPMLSDDNIPPKIIFNQTSLQKDFTAQPASISPSGQIINGYKVSPAVKPYFPFSFGIQTDEPARCKLTFLPIFDYYSLPAIWFGDPQFSTSHSIFLRFPRELSVPSRVYKYLDIESLEEIVDLVTNLEDTYERYKDKYSTEIALFETMKGIDITEIGDEIVKLVLNTIQPFIDLFPYVKDLARILLTRFEDNTYLLFVKCIDEAGNQNTEQFFIEFQIDVDAADNYPPEFLESYPKNNSEISSDLSSFELRYYVNEPSECHYDYSDKSYESMAFAFDCPSNPLDISSVAKGSYGCIAEIPFDQDNVKLFVRCLDNPIFMEDYKLRFNQAENTSHKVYSAPYFELLPPDTLNIDSALLEDIEINTDTLRLNLNIFFDGDKVCRYSLNNETFEPYVDFSPCEESDNPIGDFKCSTNIPTTTPVFIKCMDKQQASRNKNSESTVLNFFRSEQITDILEDSNSNVRVGNQIITDLTRVPSSSPIIGIVFDNPISENNILCGYFIGEETEEQPISMAVYNQYIYEAQLSDLEEGRHLFAVKCWDNIGNSMRRNIEFIVET